MTVIVVSCEGPTELTMSSSRSLDIVPNARDALQDTSPLALQLSERSSPLVGVHRLEDSFTLSLEAYRSPDSNFSQDEVDDVLRTMNGEMMGAALSLNRTYRPFMDLDAPADVDLRHQLLIFLQTLAHTVMHSEPYGILLKHTMVDLVLSDVEQTIEASLHQEERQFVFPDALIEAAAAPGLVETYSVGVDRDDGTLHFSKKNRAEPDVNLFPSAMLSLRALSFLENEYTAP